MSQPDQERRDLLCGLLALQTGFIDQQSLLGAFQIWTLERPVAMADVLEKRGVIDRTRRNVLESLVEEHLRQFKPEATDEIEPNPGSDKVDSTVGDDPDPFSTTSFDHESSTSTPSRFRIVRHHARGGLGVVYVALDTELNREVALKQLLEHHADNPSSRSRFLLEAEVTGGLEHPGIVPVYGLGHDFEGRPYYAMRFIRGDTLKDAIAKYHGDTTIKSDPGARSLGLRKLLRRYLDSCNAIDYAHTRGVVHRDLKPSNILVGKHGETLVVDWGLAKAVGRKDDTPTDERTLVPGSVSGSAETLPGSALGTPAYMSPEQALGDLARVGPTSDVYSLGATLYSILTGKAPFEGTIEEVLLAVQKGTFVPPRSHERQIPAALDAICLKAMALKPSDRYESPRLLAEDVERWMADEPVQARTEPLRERVQRKLNRHRTAMAVVVATLIAAAIGLGVNLAVQARANRELQVAYNTLFQKNAELAELKAQADRTNQSLNQANEQVSQQNLQLRASNEREMKASRELSEANQRERQRFDQVMKSIKSYRKDLETDSLFNQPMFKDLQDKVFQNALKLYGDLRTELSKLNDPDSRRRLAIVEYELGNLYLNRHKLTQNHDELMSGIQAKKQSLALRRELVRDQKDNPELNHELASSLLAIGILEDAENHAVESRKDFDEARTLLERAVQNQPGNDKDQVLLAWNYELIGQTQAKAGQVEEAIQSYGLGRKIREKITQENPSNLTWQQELGKNYEWTAYFMTKSDRPGRLDEAISYYRKANDLYEGLFKLQPLNSGYRDQLFKIQAGLIFAMEKAGRKKEAEIVKGKASSPYQSTAMPGVQAPGSVPPGGDAVIGQSGGVPSSGLGGFSSGAPGFFSMIGD